MSNKKKQKEKSKMSKKVLLGTITGVVLLVMIIIISIWKITGDKNPSTEKAFQIGAEVTYMDEVYVCLLQTLLPLDIDEDKLSVTLEDGTKAADYYKNSLYDVMERYKIECQIAKEQGLELSEDEKNAVNDDVTIFMSSVSGRLMRDFQITKESVSKVIEDQHLAHKLEASEVADVKVDDLQYCTIYYLMFPKVQTDESGNFILGEDNETPLLLSDEEIAAVKEDANKARERLLAGEECEKVAKDYGVESFSGKQSNLLDGFEDPIDDWIKGLKDNECSEVKELSSCYVVIKMLDSQETEKKEQVVLDIKVEKENQKISEKMKEWRKKILGDNEENKEIFRAWNRMSLYDFLKVEE